MSFKVIFSFQFDREGMLKWEKREVGWGGVYYGRGG